MPGTKQEKAEAKKSTADLKAERQSDATDDESLKAEQAGASDASNSRSDRSPSPDGQFDDREERDKAGPM
jgi:hypothetical protein